MSKPSKRGWVTRAVQSVRETRAGTKERRCVKCGSKADPKIVFPPRDTAAGTSAVQPLGFYFCPPHLPPGWTNQRPPEEALRPGDMSPWVDA